MRHAIEQHLNPAPLVADVHSDDHPYNRGVVIAYAGRDLAVYMMTESPGEFYLDELCKRPATDDQAKAAFGHDGFAKYRHQAREVAANRRIEQEIAAVAAKPTPEDKAEEEKVQRQILRAKDKLIQAAADKQRTSYLDSEQPIPHS
jgi:hypothetical protein